MIQTETLPTRTDKEEIIKKMSENCRRGTERTKVKQLPAV